MLTDLNYTNWFAYLLNVLLNIRINTTHLVLAQVFFSGSFTKRTNMCVLPKYFFNRLNCGSWCFNNQIKQDTDSENLMEWNMQKLYTL